jgi:putative transposase
MLLMRVIPARTDSAMDPSSPPWPHAPTHKLGPAGTFFVTASTLHHAHHFQGSDRLSFLQRSLLAVVDDFDWSLEAWAVFSNHYHFVAHAPGMPIGSSRLADMLSVLHSSTAGWINSLDEESGRQVWCNYRETQLTYQKSYLARLNYVHQNPVRHGLVAFANQYPWCSAGWFEKSASPAQVRSIYRFKTDRIEPADRCPVAPDW